MGFLACLRGDLVTLGGALRGLRAALPIARSPTRVFPHVFEELAAKFGKAPALLSDGESYTFHELNARANRYAHWALAQNLRKGEVVCLLMPNRPEYMAVWLGVTRAGGVVALLNTHLVGPSLAHGIDIVRARHIIVAAELAPQFSAAQPHLAAQAQVWSYGGGIDAPDLAREIESFSARPLTSTERPVLTIDDRALYIYTSGTTGHPKAANVNHYRLMLASFGFAAVMRTRPSDRMYDCLPMFHTVGGIVATGALLAHGGSVVIRDKFSARDFWQDIARWDCTLFQYIGEVCRYLLTAPAHPHERHHRIRLCCGNGLRPDIWQEFQRRFRLPRILEFYAATEGNVSMFNFEGMPGAVGRVPRFLANRFPTAIVRFDFEREVPMRDARGFCVPCADGEVGEVIGQILNDPSKPSSRFDGYADKAATEQKILRGVFAEGDAWFRTGDLMRRDGLGYFYFVDRIGDTFRWKGENVATLEVAETISTFPGVLEVNVYGVGVSGKDGRAGMAAMRVSDAFDIAALPGYLAMRLPDYARPLFIRLREEIEVTATFKQKKVDLVKQGFDPALTRDAIFFFDADADSFVRLDAALHRRIVEGQVRV